MRPRPPFHLHKPMQAVARMERGLVRAQSGDIPVAPRTPDCATLHPGYAVAMAQSGAGGGAGTTGVPGLRADKSTLHPGYGLLRIAVVAGRCP